jgi:hypothetical protein
MAILACVLATAGSALAAGGDKFSLDSSDWKIAPQADVSAAGEQISTYGYKAAAWVHAQVPGTVFGSYVNDKIEKDPNYADNVYKVDKSKYDRNFWYRTDFTVPASFRTGRIWLNLDGVNRDADVFVNGKSVGSMHGFFQRGRFDITAIVNPTGSNSLAVLAYVPPMTKNEQVDTASPTFICSRGWDWMPRVPGLNMGVYKDVYLTNTGDVSVIDPWVRTELPTLSEANLSIQVDLQNHSSASVTGVLSGAINPGNILFTKPVTLNGNETQTVQLTNADIAALSIANPKLWWPNGYGNPNLYTCKLAFNTASGTSDKKTVTFGIKKYTYDTDNDTLHFHINGVRVFPKGGSWGMAEYMLRCNAKDYDTKLSFHKDMHFNMIRNWMGMTADDAFYDACDKNGVMVWDEFWLNSGGAVPADVGIYNANAIEKIKQVRNHPCVAFWCAENEGTPEPLVNDGLRADVHTYDGDDRRYQPNSHADSLSGSGPWTDMALKQYFTGSHGWGGTQSGFGMRSELGMATFPNFDSVKKFLPQSDWWPKNIVWDQHFWGYAPNAGPTTYTGHINARYGQSQGLEEFCDKAQLLNYEAMKALFEGFLDHSDIDASGVLIWMSQSAYPSFVWQTYDYYYDTTGSYWGAKSACEPVHIYWNCNDDRIRVVNTSGKEVDDLTANAWIYNLDGSTKYHNSAVVSSKPDAVATCFTLAYPDGLTDTHFIRLRLTDQAGNLVSENFYWRGLVTGNYHALTTIPTVKLRVATRIAQSAGTDTMTADITNPESSHTVAVAIRPKLVTARTDAQVLPVMMSDGYFSLLPGETKTVTINFDPADAGGKTPKLEVECYNNDPKSLPVVNAENLAQGKPATASSSDDAASDPNAAVDGDLTTRWSSAYNDDPQWLCVDLGKSQHIGRVKLTWESAFAKDYQIQVSDDNANWTTIYQTTTGNGGTEDLTGLNGQGRYIRMYATKRATQWGDSLFEFEVYGPPAKH